MTITNDHTIAQLQEMQEFAEFKEYLNPIPGTAEEEIMNQIPIRMLPESIVRDVAGGYDCLLQLCGEGKRVFYPLHGDTERKQIPALRDNVMLHFPVSQKAPFAIICPGGGYHVVCSPFEGFPVAAELNKMGFHAFVVQYRTAPNGIAPNPQNDLAAAVRYIIDHADELQVEVSGYALIGFSAGGHLAGSFVIPETGFAHYGLPCPGTLILGYPVVTMTDRYTHPDCREALLGEDAGRSPVLCEQWSLEIQFDSQTPPVYLWQCEQDNEVPIENSRMLDAKLSACGVPHKYEVFPGDAHGWGLGIGTDAEGWLERAVAFWQSDHNDFLK